MNYLAHLHLAGTDPEAVVGSFLGDFLKGPVPDSLPEGVRRAVVLHRRVDSWTDAHPLVVAARGRVGPARRRYAGILLDLYFDHLLARRWAEHSGEPLADFAARAYRALLADLPALPPRLAHMAPVMAREDWLSAYAEVEGIARALAGIARRSGHTALAGGEEDLLADYAGFDALFSEFYPALQGWVQGGVNWSPKNGRHEVW